MTVGEISFTTDDVYMNIVHTETGLVDTLMTTADKAKADYGTLKVTAFSESGSLSSVTAEAED